MTLARVGHFAEIQWWPSPVHAATMMLIGSTSWRDADPAAPPECEGMIRVRVTQAEISEILNTSPQTIRRVFADFEKMQVLKRAEPSRRWYMDRRVDDVAGFTRQMRRGWTYMRSLAAQAATPEQDDDGTRWLEELLASPPPEETPEADARPPRPLDDILHPTKPPSADVRLISAISAAAGSGIGIHASAVSEWYRSRWTIEELIEYLDASNYSTVLEWLEDNSDEIREHVA